MKLISTAFVLILFAAFIWASPSSAQQRGKKPMQIPLKDSIEGVLKNHNSLKALEENRVAVGHEINRAKAGWGPRVDAQARAGFGRLNDSTTRSYGWNLDTMGYSSGSIILTQPLWDGGMTWGRVQEAEATYRSLDWRVLDNANTLALDAIIAHIDVLRRQEILRLSEENVKALENILAMAKARESEGMDTMADVTQAQSRLSRARSTLVEVQALLRNAEDLYTRLTRNPAINLAPVNMPTDMFTGARRMCSRSRKSTIPKLAPTWKTSRPPALSRSRPAPPTARQ